MIDYGLMNTSKDYAHSFDINFKPTPSVIPEQRKEQNTFNTDFTNFLNKQETVPQIQDRYSNKYNVPYLQQQNQQQMEQMNMLANSLKAIPQSINSASSNSLLTQGQKDRLAQSQAMPLQNQYNTVANAQSMTGQQLGQAEQNVNKAVSFEQADQMKKTQPWMMKYNTMNIVQAAERTEWTQTNQWELDRLLANQQTGATLSEGQQNRLYQLASQENAFHNQLDMLEKQNEYAVDMWS